VSVLQPKEKKETIARQSAMINIDNFKSFMARKRWKVRTQIIYYIVWGG
jgi:hypothetical protein